MLRGADHCGQHGAADEARMAGGSEITADSWLRRFFVCLCAENEPKVFINGTIAAGKWWLALHSPVFAEGRGDANLARAFSNAICAGAVSRQRLELIFTGIGPLQQQFTALLNRELELTRRVQNRDAEIDDLTREKTDLESRLATLEVDKAAAQERSTELQQSLTEAEERYHLLDQHWRAVSEQSLNKQSGSFRERIGHELQEALLSLQRESPNVSMALLRLKRIDEILKNATPREE
jgi:regulator of replication initiation timing